MWVVGYCLWVKCVGRVYAHVCVFLRVGVVMWLCVARRFINWISALRTKPAETVESLDRHKADGARRFINAEL